jgi:hypothetical protein
MAVIIAIVVARNGKQITSNEFLFVIIIIVDVGNVESVAVFCRVYFEIKKN